MIPKKDIQALIRWFKANRRDLPWREQPTPYAVWVSEVMLQQTRASVVIPYFEKWMERFPTIENLAAASQDEVIKLWEGLGYYSRARNLHKGAQQIVQEFEGEIPSDPVQLAKIKGLGPYTVGAISSFAFHQKISAVDGNVLRVLSRYFDIHDDIAKPKTVTIIRKLADQLLPEEEHWIVNEALIELGATLCGKKLQCTICPLKASCQGYAKGTASDLPMKSKGCATISLHRGVALIESEGHFLVRKGQVGKVMQDLYEFPYCEASAQADWPQELTQLLSSYSLSGTIQKSLKLVKHSFTKYQAFLYPYFIAGQARKAVPHHEWHPLSQLANLPFSSGHKRILEAILRN